MSSSAFSKQSKGLPPLPEFGPNWTLVGLCGPLTPVVVAAPVSRPGFESWCVLSSRIECISCSSCKASLGADSNNPAPPIVDGDGSGDRGTPSVHVYSEETRARNASPFRQSGGRRAYPEIVS